MIAIRSSGDPKFCYAWCVVECLDSVQEFEMAKLSLKKKSRNVESDVETETIQDNAILIEKLDEQLAVLSKLVEMYEEVVDAQNSLTSSIAKIIERLDSLESGSGDDDESETKPKAKAKAKSKSPTALLDELADEASKKAAQNDEDEDDEDDEEDVEIDYKSVMAVLKQIAASEQSDVMSRAAKEAGVIGEKVTYKTFKKCDEALEQLALILIDEYGVDVEDLVD